MKRCYTGQLGSTKVTAEQLNVLAEAATQPHLTLQVIPSDSGAHAGAPGSFVIMKSRPSRPRPGVHRQHGRRPVP